MTMPPIVRRLRTVSAEDVDALSDVLIDCVDGGASVSFMQPLTRERASAFWRSVAAGVADGSRALLVADDERGICGTVQLILAQPENQPHRADLSKLLVARRARRRGLGAALLAAAEAAAIECGKSLVVLDTASGDAERLYERMGWVRVGVIPGYALWPQGGLCDTTYFYKRIEDGGQRTGTEDGGTGEAMDLTIRRGEVSDAVAVAALAARTFYDTFAADNNPDDLALYMRETYGEAQQRAELLDPRIHTLLVESAQELVAYAMLRDEPSPDCVTGPGPIELWRFYVNRAWHGRGLAQRLMAAVDAEARARGASTLWLGVWERNFRAQAFYRKVGFHDVGSHVFLVGTDPQTDRIFIRSLT